ncbi:MAG: hypothetical protein ACTHXC_00445 [Brachybacterium sp.]
MTQELTFTSRVKKQEKQPDTAIFVTLDTQDEESGEVTFSEGYTFHKPSDSRLILMSSAFGSAGRTEDAGSEVVATIRAMVDKEDWRKLRRRIEGEVEGGLIEFEDLMDIFGQLMDVWAEGFPTPPSSDSSTASPETGGRSTGRSRGKASTRSTSPSKDS